jgi:hypothetical protein
MHELSLLVGGNPDSSSPGLPSRRIAPQCYRTDAADGDARPAAMRRRSAARIPRTAPLQIVDNLHLADV